jgi:hypothetical protein
MKKILLLLVLVGNIAFAQKLTKDQLSEKLAEKACGCAEKQEITKENFELTIGICLLEGINAFEKDVDRIIDQIADWCEIPDLKERIVVRKSMGPRDFVQQLNAWNGTALGMAHTLRQSAFFRPKNRSKKVKNLFYAGHNTIPGIGLPMCLIGAELVYKYLVDDKSTGPIAEELKPVPTGGWKGLK